jgi:hypothetical protein
MRRHSKRSKAALGIGGRITEGDRKRKKEEEGREKEEEPLAEHVFVMALVAPTP